MKLTESQEENLKFFIKSRKSDIELEMENFGCLKCFLTERFLK